MKLETKHLAPYLPYRLKMANGKFIGELTSILPLIGDFKITCSNWYESISEGKYKPILRPFESCEKFLNVNGQIEIDSSFLSLNGSLNSINIYPDGSEWTHSIDVYNNIYVWLFENHYDVFGLIDAGLAIDINTLQS